MQYNSKCNFPFITIGSAEKFDQSIGRHPETNGYRNSQPVPWFMFRINFNYHFSLSLSLRIEKTNTNIFKDAILLIVSNNQCIKSVNLYQFHLIVMCIRFHFLFYDGTI